MRRDAALFLAPFPLDAPTAQWFSRQYWRDQGEGLGLGVRFQRQGVSEAAVRGSESHGQRSAKTLIRTLRRPTARKKFIIVI